MANVEWPVYTQDLIPYLTDQSEYWSGYYTTDPAFKQRVRQFSQIKRSAETVLSLRALAGDSTQDWDSVD